MVNKKRCYTVIILVWLLSLCLPFSKLSVTNAGDINRAIFWFSLTFITFVFPLVIVSLSYICILKAAKEQFKRICGDENSRNYNENIKVRTLKNSKL